MADLKTLRADATALGEEVTKLKESGKDITEALGKLKECKQKLSNVATALLVSKKIELDAAQVAGGTNFATLEAECAALQANILEDKAAKKKREKAEKAAKKKAGEEADKAANGGDAGGEKKGLSKKELNKLKRKQKQKCGGEEATAEGAKHAPSPVQVVGPSFPLVAAVVSMVTGLGLVKGPTEVLDVGGGVSLRGEITMARFMARRAHLEGKASLYGEGGTDRAVSAGDIDQWIEFSTSQVDALGGEEGRKVLESHLALRTFVSGNDLSLADVTVWAALVRVLGADPSSALSVDKCPNLVRWSSMLKAVPGFAPTLAGYLRALETNKGCSKGDNSKANNNNGGGKTNTKKAKAANEALATDRLPPFEHAVDGQVVTRFPPEPSGHLHIGHVKAMFLNKFYAERYHGKMLLRMDDTNPSKEKMEFEEGIIADVASLGVNVENVTHTSDYFDLILKYTVQLIAEGNAYMDDASQEAMSAARFVGEDTPARAAADPKKDMPIFFAMVFGAAGATKAAEYGVNLDEGQKALAASSVKSAANSCLRAKIDQATRDANRGNKALYDPVFFRGNTEPHARTGTKYLAYPCYDLACPVVDSHEGVTHAMRDIQYRDRAPLYAWVFKTLRIREVHIHDFSRMNFQYTLLSKRKLKWFVESGRVGGWDDPRFPTVKGVIRRGMQVEALFDFMIAQGSSMKLVDMEWDKFWNLNKKYVDPQAPRFNAISKTGAMRIKMFAEDGTTPLPESTKEIPLLPKDKDGSQFGFKTILMNSSILVEREDLVGPMVDKVSVGEKIVLLNWDVCEVTKVITEGENVVSIEAKVEPGGDFKKPKKKIQWVAESPSNTTIIMHEFDFLVKNAKPEGDKENPAPELGSKEFESHLRETSEAITELIGEASIDNLQTTQFLQLQRLGYFRFDHKKGEEIHLFMIPDGKQKSMSTISTKLDHR